MKHCFKYCESGAWKDKLERSYDVLTLDELSDMPEGYHSSLAKAESESKPEPETPKEKGRPPKPKSAEESEQ